MFRFVVGVGIACAVVIAVALLFGTLAGAIVLAFEVAGGLIALWRSRGAGVDEAG